MNNQNYLVALLFYLLKWTSVIAILKIDYMQTQHQRKLKGKIYYSSFIKTNKPTIVPATPIQDNTSTATELSDTKENNTCHKGSVTKPKTKIPNHLKRPFTK
jgi:hypothetical protein